MCEEIVDLDPDNPYSPLVPCSFLTDEFITCMPLELTGPGHNGSEVRLCFAKAFIFRLECALVLGDNDPKMLYGPILRVS